MWSMGQPGGFVGRVLAVLVTTTMLIAGLAVLAPTAATADTETGIVRNPTGPCREAFELRVRGVRRGCTHPDPAPTGVDIKTRDGAQERQLKMAAEAAAGFAAAGTGTLIPCYGDGQSGNRVQVLYVSATNQPDRYATVAPSIPAWASAADDVFNLSAAETGSARHVRFVHDSACNLVISDARISPTAITDVAQMVAALESQGFNRTDRKYLVFADDTTYCGIAQVIDDDWPGQDNYSNGGYHAVSRPRH